MRRAPPPDMVARHRAWRHTTTPSRRCPPTRIQPPAHGGADPAPVQPLISSALSWIQSPERPLPFVGELLCRIAATNRGSVIHADRLAEQRWLPIAVYIKDRAIQFILECTSHDIWTANTHLTVTDFRDFDVQEKRLCLQNQLHVASRSMLRLIFVSDEVRASLLGNGGLLTSTQDIEASFSALPWLPAPNCTSVASDGEYN